MSGDENGLMDGEKDSQEIRATLYSLQNCLPAGLGGGGPGRGAQLAVGDELPRILAARRAGQGRGSRAEQSRAGPRREGGRRWMCGRRKGRATPLARRVCTATEWDLQTDSEKGGSALGPWPSRSVPHSVSGPGTIGGVSRVSAWVRFLS